MAERAFPFTSTGSGGNTDPYTEAQTAQFFFSAFHGGQNYGVLRGYVNELAPATVSGNVTVASGAAFIRGYWYLNDVTKTITVSTPAIGTTGYRIVLRIDFSADTITSEVLASSDGVSSLPALTQNSSIWEETLATFTKTTGGVVTLTDARQFAQFSTNHVKRDGDTMTGVLALEGTAPAIRFIETDAATDEKYWDLQTLAGVLSLRTRNDSAANPQTVVTIDRNGQAISNVNFTADTVQVNTNTVWHAGNLNSSDLARLGTTSNFTAAPTISGNTVWHAGNDGQGSTLDAGLVNGTTYLPLRRQGGSASDWDVTGTTNYTPSGVRTQVGNTLSNTTSSTSRTITVTFPTAFSDTPHIMLWAEQLTGGDPQPCTVTCTNLTETGLTANIVSVNSLSTTQYVLHWMAIGPT